MSQYFLTFIAIILFLLFFSSLKRDLIVIYLIFLFMGLIFLLLKPENFIWDHVRFLIFEPNYISVLNILSLNLIISLLTYLVFKKFLITKFEYIENNININLIKNHEIDTNSKNIIIIIFFFLFLLILDIEKFKAIFNQIYYFGLILSLFLIFKKKNKYISLFALIYTITYLLKKTSLCYNYTFVEFFLILSIVFFIKKKKNFFIFFSFLIIISFSFIVKDLLKSQLKYTLCSSKIEHRSLYDELSNFDKFDNSQITEFKKINKFNINYYKNLFYDRFYLRFISPYVTLASILDNSNKDILQNYRKNFYISFFPFFIKEKFNFEFNQNKFGRDIQMINSDDHVTALTINMLVHGIITFGNIFIYISPVFISLIFAYLNYFEKKINKLSIFKLISCYFTYNVIGSIEQGTIFDIIKNLIFCFLVMNIINYFIQLNKK